MDQQFVISVKDLVENSMQMIETADGQPDQLSSGPDGQSEQLNHSNEELFLMEDKRFIIDLVNKMDDRLSFLSKEGKSQAWSRFQKIYYKNIETNFVKCIHCNDIKKHNKYLGTAAMLRHRCDKVLSRSDHRNTRNDSQRVDENGLQNDLVFNSKNINKDKENSMVGQTECYNDKTFLLSLIEADDQRLSFEPQVGKSEVWTRFERIVFDNKETLYVKCKTCNDIQKQTRFLGTTSLLRHRCEKRRSPSKHTKTLRKETLLQKVIQKQKCETFEEKVRLENKTLKTIIKKCLEMIEKCICINRTVVNEKKRINFLINCYNEWLFENQEFEEIEENNDFEDTFDHRLSKEDSESLNEEYSEEESNIDSDYEPSKDAELKRKANNTKKVKSSLVKASNSVKRKYMKKRIITVFRCDYPDCGRTFNNSYNLLQHRNKHSSSNKYRCDWPGCDEKFSKKVQYEMHMCSHTNDKNFKCDFEGCGYQSYRSSMLNRHKKLHTGEKPFKCDWPGCDFATSHKNGLRHHKYRHSGEKPYKCSWPSCDWSFRQGTHLKAHMLKHTGERPHQCEVDNCDRRFTSRQAMRFHAEKVHNIVIPLKL